MSARPRAAAPVAAPPGATPGTPARLDPPDRIGRYMLAGLVIVFLLVGGIGGWAATTTLSGALLAPGTVVVESNIKKVQHPSGGVVGEILVKEGDTVRAGDLLMRLDETMTKANLQVYTNLLTEIAVRQVRLRAERDGLEEFQLPPSLAGRREEAQLRDIFAGEVSLFENRKRTREGQKSQLRERIVQLREEIVGITAQQQAKATEIGLIKRELIGIQELEAKQLVTMNKVHSLKREAARLEGERAQLIATAAQARGKIAEIELQVLQIEQDLKTEVTKELREVQAKEAELSERRVAAEDQLKRVDIRSPQTGIVHQLTVHTVGGVVNAGEPLMLIVPEGDRLVLEAKVAPQDRDQIHERQPAFVRFPAFNQRTTPEFAAVVQRVSAELSKDQQTGQTYFLARLELTSEALDQLRRMGLTLVPGMPADVQITTEHRTALSYIVKPLEDQIAKAFRER